MTSELERIARLARAFAAGGEGIEVGIGDDAAVLATGGERIVWTIDAQVEGTHFRRDFVSWHDIGWRATMAAASDLAAMGARPWCALAALVLSDDVGDEAFDAIAAGQRAASDAIGAPIVGGNLARGRETSISTTFLGRAARPVRRSGARVGDVLWLAGEVGLAAAGLRALVGGVHDAAVALAIDRWRRPRALVDAGLAMADHAHAAIDVSDGLARDASHVALASGVCIAIDAAALRTPPLCDAARALGVDPIELALHGGEDYALVVAAAAPIDGFARIGEARAGTGVVLVDAGAERAITPRGYDHFA